MIDFRSDTVTRPSPAMRDAMASARVGDDVWGDDPTVADLEAKTAALLGKAAAVFVPSGTQSNLCAILAHCQRGDEYIVGANAHTYKYEGGGAAVLGSVQPQPVAMGPNGLLDLTEVAAVVKADDHHFARSKLLCLENTHDGKVQSIADMHAGRAVATAHNLSFHLDGARMWNASVALGVEPGAVAEPFDSVSVCLSKGLGAPIGSVLVGSPEIILEARKYRKMLGGGMRQAGIIAAAGIYAIEHNIARLADDHARAATLAAAIDELPAFEVMGHATNMVFLRTTADASALQEKLAGAGTLIAFGGETARLVTHLDISDLDVTTTVEQLAAFTA